MRRPRRDPKTGIALIRVSTSKQELGPTAQRNAIESWAEREGIRVAAWFEETVSGAADPANRPGFQAALAAIGTHRAGLVVLHERSRLARDVDAAGHMRYVVRQHGAEIVTTDGAGSRLEGRIRDVLSEAEREEIRARTRRAMAVLRAQGQRVSRYPPLGFRFDRGRLVPDEQEGAIVARVRRLRRAGWSFQRIADKLNATTPPRPGSKAWHAATVWLAVRPPR